MIYQCPHHKINIENSVSQTDSDEKIITQIQNMRTKIEQQETVIQFYQNLLLDLQEKRIDEQKLFKDSQLYTQELEHELEKQNSVIKSLTQQVSQISQTGYFVEQTQKLGLSGLTGDIQ